MEERANSPDGSLERRLALLRSLAEEIEQAQTALLHSDPHAIESHTARQRDICLQLQADRQQQDLYSVARATCRFAERACDGGAARLVSEPRLLNYSRARAVRWPS